MLGYKLNGVPFHVGTFTESNNETAIYVRGDRVRIIPSRRTAVHESKQCIHGKCNVSDVERDERGDKTSRSHGVEEVPLAPQPKGSLEVEGMPDANADAKLERLPSNTPVLRPWGEATGVERRWRSVSRSGVDGDVTNASYVSHPATVVVGDSDMESKEGSSTSSSIDGESTTWPRPTTLSDMISTALPILTAGSSDISENRSRVTDSGAREVIDVPTLGSVMGMASAHSLVTDEHRSGATNNISDKVRAGDVCVQGAAKGHIVSEEILEDESKLPSLWKWSVKILAGAMSRNDRLRLFLKQRKSLEQHGPSLEEARELMKAWTPDMDKSLLELLSAVGTKAVSPRTIC